MAELRLLRVKTRMWEFGLQQSYSDSTQVSLLCAKLSSQTENTAPEGKGVVLLKPVCLSPHPSEWVSAN